MADSQTQNILFICSMNRWRSRTAETVYARDSELSVRSAGTAHKARRPVSAEDIRWADQVLVMEDKHAAQLSARFPDALRYKPLHVLGIPDDYRYMDEPLVALIVQKTEAVVRG